MLVGTTAVTDWARGEELTYNVVQVVLLGLFVLVLLGLPVILRPLVHHPWAVGVPLFVGLPLLTVAAALSTRFDLPVVLLIPSAPVAIGLFVVVVVLARFEHRELARDLHDDLVTSPLSPQGDAPAVGRHPRCWTNLVLTGMIPLAYIALAVLGWVFA